MIRTGALGWIVALALGSWSSSALAEPAVALPRTRGPKAAGTAALDAAVKDALKKGGFTIIAGKPLAAAAKRAGEPPTSVAAAKEAGADFLVVITAKKVKRTFVAELEAFAVQDERSVHTASEKYKSRKLAKKAGIKLSQGLADALREAVPQEEEEPEPVAAGPVVPKDEEDGPEANDTPPVAPIARAEAEVESPSARGDQPLLRLTILGGSQASSAYAVVVGGAATALAYNLTPLFLIGGQLRFDVPGTGLGIEAEVMFSPVRYALEVEPPVEPADPGGRFLDFGGAVVYHLDLDDDGRQGLALEPLIGVYYASLSVDEQSRPVVLSYNALEPQVGTRVLFGATEDLELELDLRFRWIASYGESPRTTGDGGGGFGFRAGGGGRYWLSREFGIGLSASYDYSKVALTGTGDRPRFENDPELVDANVAASNLRVALGAILAL